GAEERVVVPLDQETASFEVAHLEGPLVIDLQNGVEVEVDPDVVDAEVVTVSRIGAAPASVPAAFDPGRGVDVRLEGGGGGLTLRLEAPAEAVILHHEANGRWVPFPSTYD